MKIFKLIEHYKVLMSLLNKREKRNFRLLLLLILVTTIFELLGVGAISPLMALATNSQGTIESSWILTYIRDMFDLTEDNIVIYYGILFILIIIFKNALSLFTFKKTSQYSSNLYKSFGIKLMKNYLRKEYSWFLTKNNSDFPRLVIKEVNLITRNILHTALVSLVNVSMIFGIIILVASQNLMVSIYASLAFGFVFGILHFFLRKRLRKLGKERFYFDKSKFKIVNDVFSGIKQVKVYGQEKNYVENYEKVSEGSARNTIKIDVYGVISKYIVEALFFTFFGLLIIFLTIQNQNLTELMPVISLYLLAGYKLMPAIQKVSSAVNSMLSHFESFKKLKDDLNYESELIDHSHVQKLSFTNEIAIKNLTFSYGENLPNILDNLSVQINKGEKIGIVGGSGSGKTTFLNLLLGLIHPKSGEVYVDDIAISNNILSWRKNIGLVSQDVFLFEGTIGENIAFTQDSHSIDIDKLTKAASDAKILDFINTLPEGFDTAVGDRGVQISGGQAQRIAIARSLYIEPELIIFDEATSAMDNITEKSIMDSIDGFKGQKTLIIVAHRLTTVQNCDRILFFKDGNIEAEGTFNQLKSTNKNFSEFLLEDFEE